MIRSFIAVAKPPGSATPLCGSKHCRGPVDVTTACPKAAEGTSLADLDKFCSAMLRFVAFHCLAAGVIVGGMNSCLAADGTQGVAVRITAIEPASLVAGSKVTVKLRGFELKQVTRVNFPAAPEIVAEIKEVGDAGPAKGLDNNQVGNSQLTAELTLPAELTTSAVEYILSTPAGDVTGKVMILAAESAIEEHEPNNGFREAQTVMSGQFVRGQLQADKDVDVFKISLPATQKWNVGVRSGGPLLMDAEINCFDERGHFLAAADDHESRDPSMILSLPAEGTIYVTVSSAHDVGGPWQSYWLTIEEAK